jgi:hypothetical protein
MEDTTEKKLAHADVKLTFDGSPANFAERKYEQRYYSLTAQLFNLLRAETFLEL